MNLKRNTISSSLTRKLIVFFIIGLSYLSTFSQSSAYQIITDKWADTVITFPINSSYNDTIEKYKYVGKIISNADIYCKKNEVVETLGKLGFGQLKKHFWAQLCNTDGHFVKISFDSSINFIGSQFLKKANFSLSQFNNEAGFYNTIFSDSALFVNSDFLGLSSFAFDSFKNVSNFGGAQFCKEVSFFQTSFSKFVDFSQVYYQSSGGFILEKTGKYYQKDTYLVPLQNTSFSKGVNFSSTKFGKGVNFSQCQFSNYTTFGNAIIIGSANFDEAKFKGHASFVEMQLPDTIFFRNVNLDSIDLPINLGVAKLDLIYKKYNDEKRRCKIFLAGTNINKLIIDGAKFELSFDSSSSYTERIFTYEQLIKRCKDLGMEESVEIFDIELQKLKLKHKYKLVGSSVIWLYEYWSNFGYTPSKIIRNTIIAFGFCLLIFFTFLKSFTKAYLPKSIGIESYEIQSLFSPFKNLSTRFKIAFFYSTLIFFGLKMDYTKVKYREYPWKILLIYLVFVTGIIHLAYLAAFILNR